MSLFCIFFLFSMFCIFFLPRIVMSLSYTCIILRLADLKTERRQLTAFNPQMSDTSYGTR